MKAAFKYFFLWLILQVIGAIILALPAYCVSMVAGGAVSDFEKVGSDPWFMSVIFLGSELLPLFFFLKMKYARLNFKYDYDFGDLFSNKKLYLCVAVTCVGCMLLNTALAEYTSAYDWYTDVLKEIGSMGNNPIGALCICLIGPILEEVVFRGAILRRLLETSWKPWVAILVSAIIFAIAHGNLVQGGAALVLGCAMGCVYYYTRSLWPCIFIHVLNNTTSTVLSWTLAGTPYEDIGAIPIGANVILAVAGVVLIYFAVQKIAKMTQNRTPLPPPIELPPMPNYVEEPTHPVE